MISSQIARAAERGSSADLSERKRMRAAALACRLAPRCGAPATGGGGARTVWLVVSYVPATSLALAAEVIARSDRRLAANAPNADPAVEA